MAGTNYFHCGWVSMSKPPREFVVVPPYHTSRRWTCCGCRADRVWARCCETSHTPSPPPATNDHPPPPNDHRHDKYQRDGGKMCQDRKVCFISCAAPSLATPICVASRRSPDRHVAAVSQPPSQPTAPPAPVAAMVCYLCCDFCSDAYMCQTDRWDVSYAPDGYLGLQFVDLMAAPPLEFDQSTRPPASFSDPIAAPGYILEVFCCC